MRTALLLALAACATPDDADGPADTEPADTEPADTDVPTVDTADPCALRTWETVGAPFVTTWCAPCHAPDLALAERSGAPPEVDLATEADVVRWLDRVRARATGDAPTMPPAGGPEADTVAAFAAWLVCLE